MKKKLAAEAVLKKASAMNGKSYCGEFVGKKTSIPT